MMKILSRHGTFRTTSLFVFLLATLCSPTVLASAPTQPAQLRAAVYSDTSAEIFWSRSSDDVIVTGYEVAIDDQILGTFDVLSLYVANLEPGRTYRYRITAIDDQGNRSAGSSISLVAGGDSAQTPDNSSVQNSNPVASPTGLRSAVYSGTALELFWDRVQGEALDYEVIVDGRIRGTTNGTSFYLQGLREGQGYRIDVVAIKGNSGRSDAASLEVSTDGTSSPIVQDPGEPDEPVEDDGVDESDEVDSFNNVRIEVYSRTAAELFWQRPAKSVSTDIYRDGKRLSSTTGTSHYDGKRSRNANHTYTLVALDAQGTVVARSELDDSGIVNPPEDEPPGVTPPTDDPAQLAEVMLVRYSNTASELFWKKARGGVSTRVSRNDTLLGQTPGNSFYDGSRQRSSRYRYTLETVDQRGQIIATGLFDEGAPADVEPPVNEPPVDDPPVSEPPANDPPISGDVFEPLASDINPDRSRYQADGYDPVNVIRVDLRTATSEGSCTDEDDSGCTLDDVLQDTDKNDDLTVDIPVHFMSDDFADDGSISNAELRLRGGGSRFAAQKSFRVKLDSKKDLWRNERYLQLNKHPFESSRQRNKLAMDLMSRVPHLPSFRSQFVNLWIDDGEGAVDYGLFTHIERANDDYLESRGLDKDGNLYKAEEFQFEKSDLENMQVDEKGKPLDKDRFETSLGIEEGKDHRALVSMMSALHDPEHSFESVLDQYFNKNNVLAWMSVNLLFRHADGTRHNYILYNPSGTEKFYFIPWDYDATLGKWKLPDDNDYSNAALKARVNYGYSLSAENVFMENFYRLPGAHDELVRAIGYLRRNFLDNTTITEMSNHNVALITPFMRRLPDSEFNPEHSDSPSFDKTISQNADAVATRFSVPIPPTLYVPAPVQGGWEISWQAAYSPTGEKLTYDVQISSSKSFDTDDIAFETTGIDNRSGTVKIEVDKALLPLQKYYVRLLARPASDPTRYWTPARNRVVEDNKQYYGMIRFDTF